MWFTDQNSKPLELADDDVCETCNTNSQIKFKTTMLKSSLYDYSDAHILVKGVITVVWQRADASVRAADRNNKQYFKTAWFTDHVSEINNTQANNAKDFDVIIPMYNLVEYSDNYSKTSVKFVAILWR